MNRLIAHVDMNSYFASVEQQANPWLRGKPVGVCAYLSPTGCIIASSIEAKQQGVKTGMRVTEARGRCPQLVLVQNEPAKYRSVTQQIFRILAEYTDRVEPYSIDEAFLDLTGWAKDATQARNIVEEIRRRIKQEIGEWLGCSIGIAYTRWLAKFASDIAAKNSTLLITPEQLPTLLQQRRLTDAWGINYRLEARLQRLGIRTLYDLRCYPVTNLRKALGMTGYYLWANVNGIELASVATTQPASPKSIGHSYCLPRKTTDRHWLAGILYKLCERTGRRLRSQQLEARSLQAWIGFTTGGGIGRAQRTPDRLFTTADIYQYAQRCLLARPLPACARIMAVSVSGLQPVSFQRSLFTNEARAKQLAIALDSINDTFGEFTIASGLLHGTNAYAADRVGYRKTVAVDVPAELPSYQADE